MNSVAFTVKVPVAHLTWSSQTGRGGLLPAGGSEVVLHSEATVALIVELGTDGFALLATLAMLARPDDQGRLCVDGGIERLRTVLGWGDEKATRVFRIVRDAGFVTREQHKDPTSRSRFGTSRLILDPVLYAPATDDDVPGGPASGFPGPGGVPAGEAPGGTASGSPGPGSPGTGAAAPRPPASGFPRSGGVAAGGAASGFPGTGQPGDMDELSDGEMGHGHEGTPAADGTAPPRPQRAALVAALELLAFTDAASFVDAHPVDVVERSVRFVVDRIGDLDNPGGYLRRLVESGGPPPSGAELAGRIGALLDQVPARARPAPPPPVLVELWGDPVAHDALPQMTADEVADRLAALDPQRRAAIEADADAVAADAARRARTRGVRLPKQAVAAERHQRLVELLAAQTPPT